MKKEKPKPEQIKYKRTLRVILSSLFFLWSLLKHFRLLIVVLEVLDYQEFWKS